MPVFAQVPYTLDLDTPLVNVESQHTPSSTMNGMEAAMKAAQRGRNKGN